MDQLNHRVYHLDIPAYGIRLPTRLIRHIERMLDMFNVERRLGVPLHQDHIESTHPIARMLPRQILSCQLDQLGLFPPVHRQKRAAKARASASNTARPDMVPTSTLPSGRTSRPNVLHSSEIRPLLESCSVHAPPASWPTP